MSWCFQSINLIWKSSFFNNILGRSKYLYRRPREEGLILANFNTIKTHWYIELEAQTTIFSKPLFYSALCKTFFRGSEKLTGSETSTLSTFGVIRHKLNEHGTYTVTFIKKENRHFGCFNLVFTQGYMPCR